MDAQNMRQMVEAPKDRTPILAKIRDDLGAFFPHYGFGGPDEYAGRFVVVHHPGLAEDGFDIGWSLSGPFGHGLGTDAVFAGWWPLPGSVPATEHDRLMAEKDAEIAMLRQSAITEAPGGHWAARDNEPNSRTDPEGHRDWQRDRDAQREEGTW